MSRGSVIIGITGVGGRLSYSFSSYLAPLKLSLQLQQLEGGVGGAGLAALAEQRGGVGGVVQCGARPAQPGPRQQRAEGEAVGENGEVRGVESGR